MTPDPRLSAFIRGLSPAFRLAVRPATRSRRAMLPPLFWLALVCASGCRSAETRLEIVSLKNPAAPERLSEHFDRVSFAVNAQNNWDIVLEIPPTSLRVQPAGPTAASAPADPPAAGARIPSRTHPRGNPFPQSRNSAFAPSLARIPSRAFASARAGVGPSCGPRVEPRFPARTIPPPPAFRARCTR